MIANTHLSDVKPGYQVEVIAVADGRRLLDMGVTPGTRMKVLAVHPFKGPVVVQIGGAQIAIGRKLARKITVRPWVEH